MKDRRYSDGTLFGRLLSEARPYWLHLIGLLFLNLLSAPVTLLLPLPMKLALDQVLNDQPLPRWLAGWVPDALTRSKDGLLLFAVLLLILIAAAMQVRGQSEGVLRMLTGEQLMLRFRSRLFQHLQRLGLSFHDTRGTADSLYRIQYDATCIEGVTVSGVIPIVTALATLLAMVYVVVRVDWQLALVALSVVPVLLILTQVFRNPLRRQWEEAKQTESSMVKVVEEVVSSIRIVKSFVQEEREGRRFLRKGGENIQARVKATITQGIYGSLLGFAVGLGTAAVLYVGVQHVQSGSLALGNLVIVLFYLAMLYHPLETITLKIGALQSALASADRAFSLLEEPLDLIERSQTRPVKRASGKISFRDVSFAFKEQPALKHISFEVEPGSLVGIAGKTGSGKTTLISLLMRFYDPTSGEILLDDADLRDYRLEDLRRQFALVLQDTILFSGSIAENIAYGRPEASAHEIVRAAKLANADEFISRLSRGFETQVGERGMSLSGGERQRISLARAFLMDAPMLILDEPTSSVDVKTEGLVMEALERLERGRTTFMISHRPNTLENCDLLLVLDQGQLAHKLARPADIRATLAGLMGPNPDPLRE